MLGADATGLVLDRLYVAVADLHNLAGWTSFDTGQVHAAHTHFGRAARQTAARPASGCSARRYPPSRQPERRSPMGFVRILRPSRSFEIAHPRSSPKLAASVAPGVADSRGVVCTDFGELRLDWSRQPGSGAGVRARCRVRHQRCCRDRVRKDHLRALSAVRGELTRLEELLCAGHHRVSDATSE